MHETSCIYAEFEQRGLAALSQVRYHWNGCWCDSGREPLSFRISDAELSELSEEVQDKVCELILRERIKRFNQPEEYLTQWEEFCKRRVLE